MPKLMLWSTLGHEGYAMGYAVSESGNVLGPWRQSPAPIYSRDGGHGMRFHDFTAGAWEANPRNMDIDLANGGGDTLILPSSKAALAFDDELARQWARDHA